MTSNKLMTPPAVEPVTLADFKAHAKIDDASDDVLIGALLCGARQWCEHYTRRAFITQSWTLSVSKTPDGDRIPLPRAPLLSVSAVRLFNDADQMTIWSADHYYVQGDSEPACLVLRNGADWPVFDRAADSLHIEYVAGYGPSADDVPEAIRLAIKQLALHWYEFRGESIVASGMAQPPLTVEALLNPYRLLSVGQS